MAESLEAIEERALQLVEADEALLEELTALRTERHLSQAEVGLRMAVSQSAVSQFERYDANPSLATIRRYALAVGARVEHRVIPEDIDSPTVHMSPHKPIKFHKSSASTKWGLTHFGTMVPHGV